MRDPLASARLCAVWPRGSRRVDKAARQPQARALALTFVEMRVERWQREGRLRRVRGPCVHEQHLVANMHQRKAKLTELADAFLVLPGGFGTLDELFEAITWRQLRFHSKPIGLWNVDGYYDKLWAFLQNGRQLGFMPEATFEGLTIGDDLTVLLHSLAAIGNATGER